MNKQEIKNRLYQVSKWYNKLDNEMENIIEDYINSIPEDIELNSDISDFRDKNAYRLAEHSAYGEGKTYWEKFKNKINNEKI